MKKTFYKDKNWSRFLIANSDNNKIVVLERKHGGDYTIYNATTRHIDLNFFMEMSKKHFLEALGQEEGKLEFASLVTQGKEKEDNISSLEKIRKYIKLI
ncbi:hypothetical protein ACQ1PF_07960 [Ornithobacterium rhinotracheale]